MALRDRPPARRTRALWKRGLDLAALGMTMLAGSRLAQSNRDQRADQHDASPVTTRQPDEDAAGETRQRELMDTGRGLPATPPSPSAARLGYEVSDMSARDMTLVLLGLALFTAAFSSGVIAMTVMFHDWNRNHPAFTPEQTARIVPPGPQLQTHPHADLRDTRARELQLLHGYAWLNPDHTAARIPIERAMALTVGKSLNAGP